MMKSKRNPKKRLRVNYKESKRLGLTKGSICKMKKVQGLNWKISWFHY
jgi:hypothetical protein